MSPFDKLPKEIKQYILKFLSHQELFRVASVSKEWQALSDDEVWQKLLVEETGCTLPTKNPKQTYKILKTMRDLDWRNFCIKLKNDIAFTNDFKKNEISTLIEKINPDTVTLTTIFNNLQDDKHLTEIFLYTKLLPLADNVVCVLCLKHNLASEKFTAKIPDKLKTLTNELKNLKLKCQWHWGDLFVLHCNKKSNCYVEVNISSTTITIFLFNLAKIHYNSESCEVQTQLRNFAHELPEDSILKKMMQSSLNDLEIGDEAIKTGGCTIS